MGDPQKAKRTQTNPEGLYPPKERIPHPVRQVRRRKDPTDTNPDLPFGLVPEGLVPIPLWWYRYSS